MIKPEFMKTVMILQLALLMGFSTMHYSGKAQDSPDKVKNEIMEALSQFNRAAQNANTDQLLGLFDNSDNIMFVGSDSAEIWKGRDQIKGHLNSIFPDESVSLDMKRIDIDYSGNTAWVFVDGGIVISLKTGGQIKAPYRFSGVLVRKDHAWKWRLFNGANPGGK
jgi:ketosteroid isomerase-like protein